MRNKSRVDGQKRNPERGVHSGLAHQPVMLKTIIERHETEVKVTEESACQRLLISFPTEPGNAWTRWDSNPHLQA